MFGREELITPEIAKLYLQKSSGNRSLSRAKIEQYKSDIASGKWQLNSDGIAFNQSGILKNGHHRLTAIVEAGVPATMWVVYDVPDSTTAYDIGKSRSMAQYLRFNEGLPATMANNNVAAIAKLHQEYTLGLSAAMQRPLAETAEFIRKNSDALARVTRLCGIVSTKRSIICRASVGYALFCAMECGISEQDLYQFALTVSTGLYESSQQSAAVMVRNYILLGSNKTLRHGDSKSRIRETKVVQTGLSDYIARKPRKRPYDEDKCAAVYSDQYIKSLKEGANE